MVSFFKEIIKQINLRLLSFGSEEVDFDKEELDFSDKHIRFKAVLRKWIQTQNTISM